MERPRWRGPASARAAAQLAHVPGARRALRRGTISIGQQVELGGPHGGLAGDRRAPRRARPRGGPRRRSRGRRRRARPPAPAPASVAGARARRELLERPRRSPVGRACSCRERLLQDRARGDRHARDGSPPPAPGTWPRSVVAITLCPPLEPARGRAARGGARRARSSRRRGASAGWRRVRPRAALRSASSSASSARRCSPCEPYTRSSRPSRSRASSSRCGPCPEKPRSRSRCEARPRARRRSRPRPPPRTWACTRGLLFR